MQDRQWFLDSLWRWKCELPEKESKEILVLEELRISEWSKEFETLMRNRLIMGAFRYGKIKATGKPKYNRIDSVKKRLLKYEETGNLELLVDCANLCLMEFIEGEHPNKHFTSGDDGEHVEKLWDSLTK